MIGQDPHSIIVPLSKQNIMQVFQENTHWQIALSDYLGNIDCHYPKNKLFSFFQCHQWILPQKTSPNPLLNTVTCFTDGTKSFKAAFITCSGLFKTFQTSFTSAQQNELYAVLQALQDFPDPLNIVTDSAYAAFSVPLLETATLGTVQSPINTLFSQLQVCIHQHLHSFFITHIQSHSNLPGPLSYYNNKVDKLVSLVTHQLNNITT